MAEIFSSLKELLKEWQLRSLILLSLTLQIVLIILGNRRKYTNNFWIKTIIWLAYLNADSVATAALGIITANLSGIAGHLDAKMELTAFWAPFLLLHLGGPDTITAYSLEDNELWSRHLLQLAVETGFAFYVFLMAWTGSCLSILSIPMMFVGLIKYGERTWVLWSTSYEERRVSASRLTTIPDQPVLSSVTEDKLLETAYGLLGMTKRFFADIALAEEGVRKSSKLFEDIPHADAFKVIEMELGFMYDVLYTKAMVIRTPWGIGLRFISFLLTCVVLVSFTTVSHDSDYSKSKVDLFITFLLLSMAIFLELYAALVLLCSDQTLGWLRKHNIITYDMGCPVLFRNLRWSNTVGQYSLLSYFLNEKPMGYCRLLLSYLPRICREIPNLLEMDEKLQKQEYEACRPIPEGLKELTFAYFQRKLQKFFLKNYKPFVNLRSALRSTKGLMSLEYYNFVDKVFYSLFLMEFEQNIIIWHMATELCYHLDNDLLKRKKGTNDNNGCVETDNNALLNSKMSKYISRYMMYLLVTSPEMLPAGGVLSETNLRSTCSEARKLLKSLISPEKVNEERERETKIQACRMLLDQFRDADEELTSEGSLLFQMCKVVHVLYPEGEEEEKKVMQRWSAICGVWMELLGYASIQCKGSQHGQQLRQGGEFLTHVALLMAHFNYEDAEQDSASSDVREVTMDKRSPATEVVWQVHNFITPLSFML